MEKKRTYEELMQFLKELESIYIERSHEITENYFIIQKERDIVTYKIEKKEDEFLLERIIHENYFPMLDRSILSSIKIVKGEIIYPKKKYKYYSNYVYGYFYSREDFNKAKSADNDFFKDRSIKLNRRSLDSLEFEFYNYSKNMESMCDNRLKNKYGLIGYELNISNFKSCLKDNCRDTLEKCEKYLHRAQRELWCYEKVGSYISNLLCTSIESYMLFYDYSDNKYRNKFELDTQLSYLINPGMIISGIYRSI